MQGRGIGSDLVRAAYELARQRSATDLTFEDPTPNLQQLRGKLDLQSLRQLDFLTAAAAGRAGASGPEGLALRREEVLRAEQESKVHCGQVSGGLGFRAEVLGFMCYGLGLRVGN